MIRKGVRRLFHLALRRRDQWERDVEEEIKLHLAFRAEQLADRGMPPDAARAEAIHLFGPLSASRACLSMPRAIASATCDAPNFWPI